MQIYMLAHLQLNIFQLIGILSFFDERMLIMNFKHITYRPKRNCYQVLIRRNNKNYSKTCKTISEALAVRNQFYNLLDLDVAVFSKKKETLDNTIPTFADAYIAYLEHIKKMKNIAPSTLYTYKRPFNLLKPYVGKSLITEISREMWNDVLVNLQNNLSWSRQYTKHLSDRIKAMYDYYILNVPTVKEKLKSNPLNNIDLIQTRNETAQVVFNEREKEVFLTNVKRLYGDRWFLLFKLYFETGCRKGELIAVKWQDISFADKTIDINKSISKGVIDNLYQEYVGKTKTAASNRTIPISDKMAITLMTFRNLVKGKDNDFVFKNLMKDSGKYDFLTLSRVTYVFADVRKQCNINQALHVHSIRHYFATKLMTAGVDLKTVMALGGWSKSSTLIEIYTHATLESKKKAMMNAIFSD